MVRSNPSYTTTTPTPLHLVRLASISTPTSEQAYLASIYGDSGDAGLHSLPHPPAPRIAQIGGYPLPATFPYSTLYPDTPHSRPPRRRDTTTEDDDDHDDAGPGPGAYSPQYPESSPAWTLGGGKAPRTPGFQPTSHPVPPPGAYHPSPSFPSGPAFSLTGRPAPQPTDPTPGPADYDTRPAHRDGPAWTLAGPVGGVPTNHVPGPGEYSLHTSALLGRGPAYTMAGREGAKDPTQNPAPGAYDVDRSGWRDGPAFTMGRRPEDRRMGGGEGNGDGDLPEPGAYEVDRSGWRDGPAYTMGARIPAPGEEKAATLTGPGAYDLDRSGWRDGPAYTMAGRMDDVTATKKKQKESIKANGYDKSEYTDVGADDDDDDDVPISYLPDWTSFQVTGPAFSFAHGSARKGAERLDDATPGPDAYTVPSTTGRGPAFTMGSRVLGPGESAAAKDAAARVPVAYQDVLSYRATGPAYTLPSGRPDHRGSNAAAAGTEPGPGAYLDPAWTSTGPSFTVGVRRDVRVGGESGSTAAPGDYDLPAEGVTYGRAAPSYSIPLAKRPVPGESNAQRDVPAPGAYDVVRPSQRDGPAYSIPLARRVVETTDPDAADRPVAYATPVPLGHGAPAFTLGTKHAGATTKDPTAEPRPGPGAYSPDLPVSAPAYSIPLEARFKRPGTEPDNSETGPGAYEVGTGLLVPSGPAITMGARWSSATQPTEDHRPVSYLPLSDAPDLPRGPAFTLGHRPGEGREKAEPGPGPTDYDPYQGSTASGTDPHRGPAYSIPSAVASRVVVAMGTRPEVGPGAYEIDESSRAVTKHGPAYSMPTAARPGPTPSTGTGTMLPLGPGEYQNVAYVTSGPAYTVGARVRSSVATPGADVPGPNAYNVLGAAAATMKGGAAYTMGAKIKSGPTKDVPGPGQYEMAVPGKGPAFTLAGRGAGGGGLGVPVEEVPGPGQYTVESASGGPAYSMGTSGRPEVGGGAKNELLPAPGDYDVVPKHANGPAFTMGERRPGPKADAEGGPAPGEYGGGGGGSGPAGGVGAEGPAWTMVGRPVPGKTKKQIKREEEKEKRRQRERHGIGLGLDQHDDGRYGRYDRPARGRGRDVWAPGDGILRDIGGKRGPAFTMAGREKDPRGVQGDDRGPGLAHGTGMGSGGGPAYSMTGTGRGGGGGAGGGGAGATVGGKPPRPPALLYQVPGPGASSGTGAVDYDAGLAPARGTAGASSFGRVVGSFLSSTAAAPVASSSRYPSSASSSRSGSGKGRSKVKAGAEGTTVVKIAVKGGTITHQAGRSEGGAYERLAIPAGF